MNSCVSPRIIFSANTDVDRGCLALPCLPCSLVDSVASPQSNMGFCVLCCIPFVLLEQQMESGAET